jgi:hypothetical protein
MSTTIRRETLRQFTERRIREIAAEYDVTMREVRELYPAAQWYDEWWNAIRRDAADGQIIDQQTLDALIPMHRRYLAHDYPRSIPAGYVFPEAR